jgi:PTS system nitrogen regulatory IIA component
MMDRTGFAEVDRRAQVEQAMGITDLFRADGVFLDLAVGTKTELLRALSAKAVGRLGCPEQDVFRALQVRERLGSTALGRGVALPNARLAAAAAAPVALLARLRRPIEFEARDDEPVDLVFLVLWPEESPEGFLPALSEICRALREPQVLRGLRRAKSPEEALAILRRGGSPAAAAPGPEPEVG